VDQIIRLWLRVSLATQDRIDRSEKGAALVEYALLVGLIAAVCITLITKLGAGIISKFQSACNSITGATC